MSLIATGLTDKLRALAGVPPTDLPFFSAYVDLTPELDAGTRPFGGGDGDDAPLRSWRRQAGPEARHVRPGVRRMRDLLREKEALLPARGAERESFDADAARVLEFLEGGEAGEGFDPAAQGAAIFACSGDGFWQVVQVPVPVETRLMIDRMPVVHPLVRLDDEYERFLLCIADSQSARVYVVALGRAESEETLGGPTINYKMTGGWSQRRIQERISNAVSYHVRDVARRLEEIVAAEGIGRIVLGGDEIMLTEFKDHLSPQAWERVVAVDRLDIRLPEDPAVSRALEAVLEAEREEAQDVARLALDATLADGLGAAGPEAVAHALRQGAVDTLVLDTAFDAEGWRCAEDPAQVGGGGGVPEACPVGPGPAEPAGLREGLTALAVRTGAHTEFVENSEALARMGGVAALLRWRPGDLPPSPVEPATADAAPAPAVAGTA
jgi:peptide subunit release factor 1 (eRF1)